MNSPFQSCSQAGQDIFAWEVMGYRKNCTFLDVGCYNLCWSNNSYALEQQGWSGLLVDIFKDEENLPKRVSPFIQGDARTLDWLDYFRRFGVPTTIDYLSLDVDENTCETLMNMPLDVQGFNVITVEHDAYVHGTGPRDKMRARLCDAGYMLIAADVLIEYPTPGNIVAFEDWWCSRHYMPIACRFNSSRKLWNEILKQQCYPL